MQNKELEPPETGLKLDKVQLFPMRKAEETVIDKQLSTLTTEHLIPSEPDAMELLRQQIEAEERARLEEEQLRTEIRNRLRNEATSSAAQTGLSNESQLEVSVAAQPIVINVNNSNTNSNSAEVNVATGAVAARKSPHFFLRALYFLTFGWWVGFLWVGVALLLCLTIIGLPLGLIMLRRSVEAFIL